MITCQTILELPNKLPSLDAFITDAYPFENMPASSLESHLHLRFSILEAGGNETDGCRRRPTLFNRDRAENGIINANRLI